MSTASFPTWVSWNLGPHVHLKPNVVTDRRRVGEPNELRSRTMTDFDARPSASRVVRVKRVGLYWTAKCDLHYRSGSRLVQLEP
ncbi:hypothetical protein RHGRI_000148 [Rhododendron griersonianum]|uniref:Uncharacterized protein n=1 Tax=Rhododendron griersonianum TaxID=479676 RepID=A0AAV6LHS1_9ERIC|nr:hypothetical protein RHGRI_000148 [Rhododendron griersonianum]